MIENLVVMKFGGTSLGNAERIGRAAQIVSAAARTGPVVTVVSAMSGVTDHLVQAAHQSAAGDEEAAQRLSAYLRELHGKTAESLFADSQSIKEFTREAEALIREVANLCRGTAMLRELTPRALDAISGAGERLAARLVARALGELGLESQALDATQLIVTNDVHGSAEPLTEPTRVRSGDRLYPLLNRGIIPVVTGFIAATAQGVLTTLGRGGSDFSATILAAALKAGEVIIWTDVDGVMSADPRHVPQARTLAEISYHEAGELAYFGARVLHPRTLQPVVEAEIPVWIRNSFAPERRGTKISRDGLSFHTPVKAITATKAVSLITVGGPPHTDAVDLAARTFTATAAARAKVLMISQSSSRNEICFVVPPDDADRVVNALRNALAANRSAANTDPFQVNASVSLIAVIGEQMRGTPGICGQIFSAMGREGINVLAVAQGASEFNVTFIVDSGNLSRAVNSLHLEFELGEKRHDDDSARTDLDRARESSIPSSMLN